MFRASGEGRSDDPTLNYLLRLIGLAFAPLMHPTLSQRERDVLDHMEGPAYLSHSRVGCSGQGTEPHAKGGRSWRRILRPISPTWSTLCLRDSDDVLTTRHPRVDGIDVRVVKPLLWTVRQKHLAACMAPGDRSSPWRASGKITMASGIVASGWLVRRTCRLARVVGDTGNCSGRA